MTKRHTKAERYLREMRRDDPLVPFKREHLTAAIELANSSQAAIAKQLSGALGLLGPSRPIPRQAINRLLGGEGPRRIRQRYRLALAKILDVPDPWLGGEEVLGPDTSLPNIDPGLDRRPRAWLALYRLMGRFDAALRRDAARAKKAGTPVSHDDRLRAMTTMAALVGQLLRVRRLRQWLIPGVDWSEPAIHSMEDFRALQKPQPDDPRLEVVELGLLRAFEYFLEPWLPPGEASLDYEQLRSFANALLPPGLAPDKREARGSDTAGLPLWVIERRVAEADFTTPSRLGEARAQKQVIQKKKR